MVASPPSLPTARDLEAVLLRRLARPLGLGREDLRPFAAHDSPALELVRLLAREGRHLHARRVDATLTPDALRVVFDCEAPASSPHGSAKLNAQARAVFGVPLLLGRGVTVSLPRPDPSARAVAAAAPLARNYLARLRAMEIETAVDVDPEGAHELRIAARRLRAVLRLLADVVDPVPQVLTVVHAAGGAAGAVRDFDVVMALVRESAVPPASRDAVLSALDARRAPALAALRAQFASSEYLAQVRAAERALESLGTGHDSPRLTKAARAVTRRQIRRLRRRLQGDLTVAEGYHAVRRQLRRVRDTIEVFAPALPKSLRRWRRQIHPLQPMLGRFNDLEVALTLVPAEVPEASPVRELLIRRRYETLTELAAPLALLALGLPE
jgi:CHAD domain-containing protein